MWYVLCMSRFNSAYLLCNYYTSLTSAVLAADKLNKSVGYDGRYFVVSQKEYDTLWKE